MTNIAACMDGFGALDVAWAEAEAWLPARWRIEGLTLVDTSDSDDLRDAIWEWEAEASTDEWFAQPRNVSCLGHTPAVALRGLAAELRERFGEDPR